MKNLKEAKEAKEAPTGGTICFPSASHVTGRKEGVCALPSFLLCHTCRQEGLDKNLRLERPQGCIPVLSWKNRVRSSESGSKSTPRGHCQGSGNKWQPHPSVAFPSFFVGMDGSVRVSPGHCILPHRHKFREVKSSPSQSLEYLDSYLPRRTINPP